MSGKKLGRATVTVDGNVYQTYPGATMDPGGTTRNARSGHVFHGYSETGREGKLEAEIDLGVGTSIEQINGWTDVTVRFQCDTGQVYIGNHWCSDGTATFTDGPDSKVKLILFGEQAREVVGG